MIFNWILTMHFVTIFRTGWHYNNSIIKSFPIDFPLPVINATNNEVLPNPGAPAIK